MSWILEDAENAKRRIDVDAMKQTRPPRVGDLCSVCSGIVTLSKVEWIDDVVIIDMSTDGLLKFARPIEKASGRPYRVFEYRIDDYLATWKYKDNP